MSSVEERNETLDDFEDWLDFEVELGRVSKKDQRFIEKLLKSYESSYSAVPR